MKGWRGPIRDKDDCKVTNDSDGGWGSRDVVTISKTRQSRGRPLQTRRPVLHSSARPARRGQASQTDSHQHQHRHQHTTHPGAAQGAELVTRGEQSSPPRVELWGQNNDPREKERQTGLTPRPDQGRNAELLTRPLRMPCWLFVQLETSIVLYWKVGSVGWVTEDWQPELSESGAGCKCVAGESTVSTTLHTTSQAQTRIHGPRLGSPAQLQHPVLTTEHRHPAPWHCITVSLYHSPMTNLFHEHSFKANEWN